MQGWNFLCSSLALALVAACGSVNDNNGSSHNLPDAGSDVPPMADSGGGAPACGARGLVCCAGAMCGARATCDGTACIANDVWAAASSGTVHFDGSTWSSPLLTGSSAPLPAVNGLWGASASFVVGVGTGGVILRNDGTAWHRDQAASSDGSGSLVAVAGASATDIWAVGDAVIAHYNGATWGTQPAPVTNGLRYTGVWISGPGEGWASGDEGILAHLSGGVWTDAGHIGNGYDRPSIWGSAANDVWRVGSLHTLNGLFGAIQHYDGTSWTDSDIGASNATPTLNAVWGADATHVWAVGDAGALKFWNGTAWASQLSGTTADLLSIWGSGPADVWVSTSTGMRHFDGTAWIDIPGLPATASAVWLSQD